MRRPRRLPAIVTSVAATEVGVLAHAVGIAAKTSDVKRSNLLIAAAAVIDVVVAALLAADTQSPSRRRRSRRRGPPPLRRLRRPSIRNPTFLRHCKGSYPRDATAFAHRCHPLVAAASKNGPSPSPRQGLCPANVPTAPAAVESMSWRRHADGSRICSATETAPRPFPLSAYPLDPLVQAAPSPLYPTTNPANKTTLSP